MGGKIKVEGKKKINWFKIIITGLFIVYIALYLLNVSGYYDGNIRRKVEFTESQIEEFERDVAKGENIDIKKYLEDQTKDYTNGASRVGYSISKNIDSFFNRGIKEALKILTKLLS